MHGCERAHQPRGSASVRVACCPPVDQVRRLKTTVAGREKETSDQVEEALGQHAEEIGRLRAQLATRDAEVDELAAQ
eukprot:4017949-Pleurochrysis_carterae.AAC.1